MEEAQSTATTSSANSKMPLIMVLVFIVLILLAGGAWFVMNSSKTVPAATPTPTTIAPTQATEITDTATPSGVASPSGAVMTDKIVKEFSVEGTNFKFTPNKITVKKGDSVKINFKSVGPMPHNFVIDEFNVATKQITGATESATFVADKAGTFEFYCSVGNHRAQGMVGTLVVTP